MPKNRPDYRQSPVRRGKHKLNVELTDHDHDALRRAAFRARLSMAAFARKAVIEAVAREAGKP